MFAPAVRHYRSITKTPQAGTAELHIFTGLALRHGGGRQVACGSGWAQRKGRQTRPQKVRWRAVGVTAGLAPAVQQ
jgi:hypothetical protein